MKTFEQFEDIDETEEKFLQITHLDELVIKFDFIRYNYGFFYFYKDKCLFQQDNKNNYFFIRYKEIWLFLKKKFNFNDNENRYYMEEMIEKYFKLKDYTIDYMKTSFIITVDENFKINK